MNPSPQLNAEPRPAIALWDHLAELRSRILKSVLAIIAGSLLGLVYCREIFTILQVPMVKALPAGSFFIATSPFESYMAYFKVAFLTGLFIASPVVFYQFWKFVNPALRQKEKQVALPFAFVSALLFTGGALFGYFLVFPTGFHFVNQILIGTGIRLLPKMSDYLGVALTLLLAFGFCFELPLVIFLLGKLGIIDYPFIKKYRRYVIVVLFIVAAVLTPGPDVFSQCLLAIPLWILFELGGLTLLANRKKG